MLRPGGVAKRRLLGRASSGEDSSVNECVRLDGVGMMTTEEPDLVNKNTVLTCVGTKRLREKT